MASIREIGRKARRDLHRAMRVPALFIQSTGAEPVLVHVRLHTKFDPLKVSSGGPSGLAVMQDIQPKIIFERAELAGLSLSLRRNAIVTVEPDEGYRVDNTLVPDDIMVAAVVTPLSAAEMSGLPVPGGA